MTMVNWKLVGMDGDAEGSDLWKVEDAEYIYWGWIAGKILTGELLELDVGIAAEKKRDKDLEGK